MVEEELMKRQTAIKKKLSLLIFLSALAGMAVGGTLNVTAAELTEADCHDQAGHHSSGGTSR